MAEFLQGAAGVERIHLRELEEAYEPALELLSESHAFAAGTAARRAARASDALALAGLLGEQQLRAATAAGAPVRWRSKTPHFPPRAKRVIFLFMHGGPSQVDTFDYKPLLKRDHGKPLPFQRPKVVSSETFNLLKSPWEFKQYGQSGMWVSESVPADSRKRVDDICFIKSMWGSNSRHGGALLELHTGSDTFVRPVMGLVDHLRPGQREPEHAGLHHHLPHAEPRRREQLQLRHFCRRRTRARRSARWGSRRAMRSIPYIANTETPRDIQRMELDFAQEMNREQLGATGPDAALEGRIESFELAFRMQAEAPGSAGHLRGIGSHAEALRPGQPRHRGFRPAVPDGAAAVGEAACASCR